MLSLLKNDASLIRRRDRLARLGVCSGGAGGTSPGALRWGFSEQGRRGRGCGKDAKIVDSTGVVSAGGRPPDAMPKRGRGRHPTTWRGVAVSVVDRHLQTMALLVSVLACAFDPRAEPAVRRRMGMGWPIPSHPPSRAYHRPVPAWLRLRNSPPHGQDCPVRTLLLRSPYTGNATRQVQAQSTAGLAEVLGRVVETREGGRRREDLMAALADVSTPTRSRRSRARSMCATTPQAPPNLGRRAHVLCPDVCRDSPSALWPVPVPVPPCLYHVRGALKLR